MGFNSFYIMKKVFKILFTFLLVLTICSCGARKVDIKKSKEETKNEIKDKSVTESKTDTNVKITTTVKVDDKNETIIEETILEPADNTKESFVIEKDGTKIVLNNTKKTTRKTTKNNNTQTYKSGNSELVQKEGVKTQKNISDITESKKEDKSKHTERTATPWYYWLLLLIPIVIIYYFGKRYKIF